LAAAFWLGLVSPCHAITLDLPYLGRGTTCAFQTTGQEGCCPWSGNFATPGGAGAPADGLSWRRLSFYASQSFGQD
jgi:hypothetical protein